MKKAAAAILLLASLGLCGCGSQSTNSTVITSQAETTAASTQTTATSTETAAASESAETSTAATASSAETAAASESTETSTAATATSTETAAASESTATSAETTATSAETTATSAETSATSTETAQTEPRTVETPQEDFAYIIGVSDENGSPLSGVVIIFCDDETCEMLTTDERGVIRAERAAKKYEVHIMSVPEGYEKPADTFTLDENLRRVEIVLKSR